MTENDKTTENPPTPWLYKVGDSQLSKMASRLREEQTDMLNGRLPANEYALDHIARVIGGIEGLRLWRLSFNARHMAQEVEALKDGDR